MSVNHTGCGCAARQAVKRDPAEGSVPAQQHPAPRQPATGEASGCCGTQDAAKKQETSGGCCA